MRRIQALGLLVLLFCVLAPPARAVTVTPTVNGNELTGRIEFVGGVAADLTITFEQAVGLNAGSLSITATLINPLDATLLARLPSGASIPAGFPVLLEIQPAAGSTLTFSGTYRLSLYTHNLNLSAPLRLFRGPSTGPLADMTGFLEVGSVRAGGTGPGYSQFLIVLDPRPLDPVIVAKFDFLQALLTAHSGSMPPAVAAALQQQLASARSLSDSGDTSGAITAVAAFATSVKDQSGTAIPDVWQANNPGLANVAGLLRAAADTLKFSLVLKSNVGS
jgi:uncharacterized protein DUF6689